MNRVVEVEHLARVEGHGGIEVVFDGSRVEEVKFNIFEGHRFFEAIIEGVHYEKVPDIVRRICAICTASHNLASIRAIEKAFKVNVSDQTRLLRDLLIHGETIESHALHVFFLALPDFLGYDDAIRMASKYGEQVKAALQLKRAGNMVHNVLSGREVHGMNDRVGGFSTTPSEKDLLRIKAAMEDSRAIAEWAAEFFAQADHPKLADSDNTLMALDPGEAFGFIGDTVLVSDGNKKPVEEYKRLTNERTVPHSHSKFSFYNNAPFMVGALPRVLLNSNKLSGRAAELFREHKDRLDPRDSVMNNFAQALELVHSVDRCVEDIEALLSNGLESEALVEVEPRASRGVGTVEAPRGILYHEYEFDGDGCVRWANVVTPTAQNAANMEKDFRAAATRLAGKSDEEVKRGLEMIARAYDPCISCAVHLVTVKRL